MHSSGGRILSEHPGILMYDSFREQDFGTKPEARIRIYLSTVACGMHRWSETRNLLRDAITHFRKNVRTVARRGE